VRRGIKLARHAYRSRTGREPPAIKHVHFESDGARGPPLTPEEIEETVHDETTDYTPRTEPPAIRQEVVEP